MLNARPKRRRTTHVETLHGELCIYEWTTKTVHALNPAAARVWEMCDGVTTIEEMTAALRRDLNAPAATAIVEHALMQFDRAGLLEPRTLAGVGVVVSRRALLRRIGIAAAIPVVTSIVAPTPLAAQSGNPRQFDFTGAPQSFVVPTGVTSLRVDVVGAQGVGPGAGFSPGGSGGRVQATLPVTPGETLTIMVGGTRALPSDGSGGFNGGGDGGNGGWGGGGASDIRRGATWLIIAGGGGGAGRGAGGPFGAFASGVGGPGGGLVGGDGTVSGLAGKGGTQSSGGAGGNAAPGAIPGSPGTPQLGGNGGAGVNDPFVRQGGAGGGGGYFGGGGGGGGDDRSIFVGGKNSGPGGGGSSYTHPSATSVVHTQGFNSGNGRIIVSW
jgi:hypothetical protein